MTAPTRRTRGSLGVVQGLKVGQSFEFQNVRPPANATAFVLYVRTDRGVTVKVDRLSDDAAQATPRKKTMEDVVILEPPPADERAIFVNEECPPLGEYIVTVENTSGEGGGDSQEISVEATWRDGDVSSWPYAEGG